MSVRIFILLLVLAPGCASTRSTMIQRDDCDQEWEVERCLTGVPITVQVPTHIKVDVIEHHYLGHVPTGERDKDGHLVLVGGEGEDKDHPKTTVGWLSKETIGVPARSVKTSLIKTAQIFTVDPKRPGAGNLNSEIKFGGKDGQYFDDISYNVDDQTINAITGLIGKLAKNGLVGTPTSEALKAAAAVDENLRPIDGVVASGIFRLDASDLELQVARFLDSHLNNCHNCSVVLDDVIQPTVSTNSLAEPCIHGTNTTHCPSCNSY